MDFNSQLKYIFIIAVVCKKVASLAVFLVFFFVLFICFILFLIFFYNLMYFLQGHFNSALFKAIFCIDLCDLPCASFRADDCVCL